MLKISSHDQLPLALLISRISKDVRFEINPTLGGFQTSHAFLDWSSQAKHCSHVYGTMAPPTPHGPQDVAPTAPAQEETHEALVEEDEIQAMEQDTPVPKVDFLELTPRTHSSCNHASSSRASHIASTLVDLTTREMMDSMTCLHLRMDSQDTQLHEIQCRLSYIISWIHFQGASSSTLPLAPPNAQILYIYIYIYILFFRGRYFFLNCLIHFLY